MITIKKWQEGAHISKNIFYDMCDNIEYIPAQDRQSIYNIPEEFHAANAHDIMEWLSYLSK